MEKKPQDELQLLLDRRWSDVNEFKPFSYIFTGPTRHEEASLTVFHEVVIEDQAAVITTRERAQSRVCKYQTSVRRGELLKTCIGWCSGCMPLMYLFRSRAEWISKAQEIASLHAMILRVTCQCYICITTYLYYGRSCMGILHLLHCRGLFLDITECYTYFTVYFNNVLWWLIHRVTS